MGVEAPVEAKQEARALEARLRLQHFAQVQVDGLFAEHRLARFNCGQCVGQMLVSRTADQDTFDGWIGQRLFQGGDLCVQALAHGPGGLRPRVDYVLQFEARMPCCIGAMYLAHATGADQCYVDSFHSRPRGPMAQ